MKRFAYFILTLSVNSLVVLSQDKPRFSIGLGTLAPSYSQKFAGNGRLDFDQDKNGFSYSLNNVPHGTSGSTSSYQSQSNPQSYGSAPTYSSGSDYSSPLSSPQSPPSGQFSIYQHRSIPKQSADTFRSPSEDENNPPERSYLSSQSSGSQYESQPNIERQYNPPAVVSGSQGFNEPEDHSGDYKEDNSGDYKEDNSGFYNQNDDQRRPIESVQSGQHQSQSQPQFGTYNFEQQITHQIQDSQPFQSHGQSQPGLSYRSEPSQSQTQYQSQPSHPTYQSQPSHQRAIRLESQPIQSQQRLQYRPQSVYALRV